MNHYLYCDQKMDMYLKRPVGVSLFFIAVVLFCFGTSGCKGHHGYSTPSLIARQIKPPPGWKEVTPHRPKVYLFKISKINDPSTNIAVKHTDTWLFGNIPYQDFKTIAEVHRVYTKEEIKKYFEETEATDERATPVVDNIYPEEINGVAVLTVTCTYYVKNSNQEMHLSSWNFRGKDGWIAINMGTFSADFNKDFEEAHKLIKTLRLDKTE